MKTFQNVTLRFCALIAALALFAQSVQADPVLRGYWTFDEDTVDGGTIKESSGYVETPGTHDGILVNNTTVVDEQTVNGISFKPITGEGEIVEPGNHLSSGNYISFTNDSYAYILNTRISADGANYRSSFDFGGEAFTISAWVKGLPGNLENDSWKPYISKYGENGYGYQLRRKSTSTGPTFTYRDGSGKNRSEGTDDPGSNITDADTDLSDNEWHHLVGVYGGTYREVYMDGKLITHITDTVIDCSGTNEPLVFSGRYQPSSYQAFANISLDDVAIYSGALAKNQITYLNGGGDPKSIPSVTEAETTYNIPLNSPAADNITLTRQGSGTISRHWLDDDVSFDGKSFLRTNLSVGTAGFNGSFTASAWVFLNSTSDDQSIFGNNATGNNKGLHLVVRKGNPHLGFYGNDLTASTTLETGKWYYLTWQYDAENKLQKIFLGGDEIASRTGAAAFTGANVLDLGTSMGGGYLNGKLKGISISNDVLTTDQIKAQMNIVSTQRIENFDWGKNDEWYTGGGASLGNLRDYNNTYGQYKVISMFNAAATNEEINIYNKARAKVGNTDDTTGMLWGPQFTVTSDAAVFSFDAVGGDAALNVNNRVGGGEGIALWDLTTGDYVRDGSGNVLYGNGNASDQPKHSKIPINNLQGHDLMVVAIDRQTGSWAWVGPSKLEVDATQVSAIAGAAQHHVILNDFNFDTAGDFNGMYEVDYSVSDGKIIEGNRLDSVTHFTNGNRGTNDATPYYIDNSGTVDLNKGFLSSGTAAIDGVSNSGQDPTMGVLRSDPFLVQGDVMEFYISGGNDINNIRFELVDATSGEVYRSATGLQDNNFRYDFWSLKDIQGKSAYIRLIDNTAAGWGHLELDQIRQVKFAPSAVEVQAAGNSFDSQELKFYEVEPGFNVNSYNLDETVTDLTSLANYITGGADATEKKILVTLDNFKVTDEGEPVGVDVFSVLNVKSSGLYTLVIGNDEPFVLKINGKQVIASEGSDEEPIFIPLQFSEVGQYALEMLYLDTTGTGVSIYAAEGALDEWKRAAGIELLSGTGEHNLLAYAQNPDPNKIPEPSTWALLILGAAGMLYWRKRK